MQMQIITSFIKRCLCLYVCVLIYKLWTIYMELTAQQMVTAGDHHSFTMNILHDFWNKVTQSMLNLSSKSKTVCKVNS